MPNPPITVTGMIGPVKIPPPTVTPPPTAVPPIIIGIAQYYNTWFFSSSLSGKI